MEVLSPTGCLSVPFLQKLSLLEDVEEGEVGGWKLFKLASSSRWGVSYLGRKIKFWALLKKEGNRCVLYWQGTTFFFFPPTILSCVTVSLQFCFVFFPELTLFDLSLRSDTEPLLKTKRKNSNKVRLGRVWRWTYMKRPSIVAWLLLNAQWACRYTLVLRRELAYLPLNVKALYHRRAFK